MASVIAQDGYELIQRPRRLGQYVPEIVAVRAAGSGDSVAKELLKPSVEKFTKNVMKNNFGGDSFSKELCNHRICKEAVRSGA